MTNFRWGELLLGLLVGGILGVAGTLLSLSNRIALLEGQLDGMRGNERVSTLAEEPSATVVVTEPAVSSERFLDIIKAAQKEHVRESWGELADQAFTAADLSAFRQQKRPQAIAEEVVTRPEFMAVMRIMKKLNPMARQQLLDDARKPLHPTWRELGYISREGQTEAGQQAELLIAEAIVLKTKEILAR